MNGALFIIFVSVVSWSSEARSDPLEDAYKKGHDVGYIEGYAEGLKRIVPGSQYGNASIVIPGTKFDTAIGSGGNAGTNFDISTNSAVAIIPKDALGEMTQKLGPEFLAAKNIQFNNGLAQP